MRSAPPTVTLHDVARRAGVHYSTVSRALDPSKKGMVKEETRQRIVELAAQMGYRVHIVARSLKSGRTATVGVVTADLENTWVTPILHGLVSAIEVDGMLPFITETQDNHDRFVNTLHHMLSRQVDAIVVLAARNEDREILESTARSVPVVIAARPMANSALPQVVHDDSTGGHMVAEYLHGLGHRRVTQLLGPLNVANFPRRARGFSDYCAAQGMELIDTGVSALRPIMSEGQRLMAEVLALKTEPPTAVFAHNDLMAVGAFAVLRDAGLSVPGMLSLVGYNDTPMVANLTPPLTTVRYESFEVGLQAGRMVRALLAGERPSDVVVQPTLIPRGSTGPVR